ncbi:hypothetical protein [Pseudohongiella sp.]|uniref:Uncharacterized protein n=1 Tax=marine sediment metagenome TaxID=412755 RepID=A0A0F9YVT1_9ZZZZ|nr:hypothetical protein [Pseudohongiella sp.]HDZ08039.1 hypothetical protein [Pseudohongiella sp.]HEA64118.1 hypothetical protein [Pseudohongiella sp.]
MPSGGRPGVPGDGSASGAAGSASAASGGLDAYGNRSSSGGLNRIPPATTAGAGAGDQTGSQGRAETGNGQGAAERGTSGQGAGQSGSGQGGGGSADSGAGSGSVAGSGSGASDGVGVMTASQRVAVLDGQLGGAYGEFDGLILAERSRAQRRANEVGDDPAGLYEEEGGQGGGGQGGDRGMGTLPGVTGVQTAGVNGDQTFPGGDGQGPQAGGSGGSVGGVNGGPAGEQRETYPVPEDIPPGGGDDVVARQIREAALREADPELREALWDEYRRYTGLEVTGTE